MNLHHFKSDAPKHRKNRYKAAIRRKGMVTQRRQRDGNAKKTKVHKGDIKTPNMPQRRQDTGTINT
jgi:hypothetical protein